MVKLWLIYTEPQKSWPNLGLVWLMMIIVSFAIKRKVKTIFLSFSRVFNQYGEGLLIGWVSIVHQWIGRVNWLLWLPSGMLKVGKRNFWKMLLQNFFFECWRYVNEEIYNKTISNTNHYKILTLRRHLIFKR